MVIVVMGTTGAGKTTVGELLAERLGWTFADADDFHPQSNVEKMKAGMPLDDADRAPWLQSLREAISAWLDRGENIVLACSALRRAYREVLRPGPEVTFVYLKGSYEVIEKRVLARRDHFAKADLLKSQFETLEEPSPDEPAISVDVDQRPEAVVQDAIRMLELRDAK
jgi:carbohydrate kinase (thermoresistant glucokinase family)